jgi:hypothetical protein
MEPVTGKLKAESYDVMSGGREYSRLLLFISAISFLEEGGVVSKTFSMTSFAFFGILHMSIILFSPFWGIVYGIYRKEAWHGPEGKNNRILWEGMM